MSVDEAVRDAHTADLSRLCEQAAAPGLDASERRHVHADAVSTTAWLVADGRLPVHLQVEPGDPWVAVTRILARAQVHLDRESGT